MATENLRFSAFVEGMITGEFDNKTQGEIAEALGVDSKTIWEWKRRADWAHIKEQRRKLYSHTILKVDQAMLRAAEKGDVAAAKVIYERFDGWVPSSVVRNVNVKSDDDLKARAEELKKEMLGRTGPDLPGTGPA